MLDAVEWGDHDCPDCDKSFATAQEARWHQRYHCDGEADDDGQVWIGAGNPSRTDGQHVYHTNEDCPNLLRMKNPRKTDPATLNGQWRECEHCLCDDRVVTSHSNPGADHDLNLAVQNADPEEVFE